jgi:hypothetical protein
MKEKILAFLKSKLTGVSEAYLLGVADHYSKTITEDAQIEATLNDGAIDLLKLSAAEFQKEGDRRATDALKTFREKHGLDETGKPKDTPPKKDETPKDDAPEWAKKLSSDYESLKSKLESQEKEKTAAALSEKVAKHDKLKDIPASFLKGRNLVPATEADIDNLVASIEADYNGFKQEMADKGVIVAPPAGAGGQTGEKVMTGLDDYLKEKFPTETVTK